MPLRWQAAGICLALVAIAFAVFGQTLRYGFVNFDDGSYVSDNAVVRGGLSLHGLAWVFTHADCRFYHPLTMLSLMADYQLYGLHAGGYHFTNVLLHAASAVLLFLALKEMTGALWRSAFVAAVFAVHPLRVESVAWVAERKDALGAFFFILTLWAYVRYVRKPNAARYVMVAVTFTLSLLSKPLGVTLPLALLLLDWWPLRRVESWKRLVMEKLPLLALAVAAGVVTVLAEGKAVVPLAAAPMVLRLGNVPISYVVYLRQMIWPAGLAAFYPFWADYPAWAVALSVLVLVLITGCVLIYGRERHWLVTGWFWYLLMLAPMSGIIQIGGFAHADRMTYLPQIGIYLAITWLVAEWSKIRPFLGDLMAVTLGALMFCAWKQAGYWKDSKTLWLHALACTEGNYLAQNNLGNYLYYNGDVDEAIDHYQAALQIQPDQAEIHDNLSKALLQKGNVDEAISHDEQALQIDSSHAEPHCHLGEALLRKGKVDDAMAQFQQALKIIPNYAEAHFGLGNVFRQKGNMDEAMAQYQEALTISPDYADAHTDLGYALLQKGKVSDAMAHFEKALDTMPDSVQAHIGLGNAFRQEDKQNEAVAQYQTALQINSNSFEGQVNLGAAFWDQGRTNEAIDHFQKGLQIAPNNAQAQYFYGKILLASGKTAEAIDHLQKALSLARVAGQNVFATELEQELKRCQAALGTP